jgi:DNA-binding NtrC family response regulator
MNILVLDDDTGLRSFYRHIIKHIKGVGTIVFVSSCDEFRERIVNDRFHIIICDIHMQPMSGPEILRANKDIIKSIHIVMLSCSDHIYEESNTLSSEGFNMLASLQKPLVPQDLFDLIECS